MSASRRGRSHGSYSYQDYQETEPRYSAAAQMTGLEEQFILRLPRPLADHVREALRADAHPPQMKIDFEGDRSLKLVIDGQQHSGKLVNLPCILESHKTLDSMNYYKSADIGQMIVIEPNLEDIDEGFDFKNGLTPPAFNISKRKWRKPRPREELVKIESDILRNIRGGADEVKINEVPAEKYKDAVDKEEKVYTGGRRPHIRLGGASAARTPDFQPSANASLAGDLDASQSVAKRGSEVSMSMEEPSAKHRKYDSAASLRVRVHSQSNPPVILSQPPPEPEPTPLPVAAKPPAVVVVPEPAPLPTLPPPPTIDPAVEAALEAVGKAEQELLRLRQDREELAKKAGGTSNPAMALRYKNQLQSVEAQLPQKEGELAQLKETLANLQAS